MFELHVASQQRKIREAGRMRSELQLGVRTRSAGELAGVLASRRQFMTSTASGLGALALGSLVAADAPAPPNLDEALGRVGEPPVPHHEPTAKAAIFIFLAGGPSQVDLWDPKPLLAERNGQQLPDSVRKGRQFAFIRNSARLKASRYQFDKHGECGMDFSELMPHLATCTDDLAMVRSMQTDTFNHLPGHLMMSTGFLRFGHPSAGAWVVYGLGSESSNLPGYVVMTAAGTVRGGGANWSNGFLPPRYQGVHFRNQGAAVLNLEHPPGIDDHVQRVSLDGITALNRLHYRSKQDPEIASRIAAYELAFGMQMAAPRLIDLSTETADLLDEYGVNRTGDEAGAQFSRSCLLARRMVEQGVRFVTVFHGEWDHHGNLHRGLTRNCPQVDQPLGALIKDLKRRGLLDSTVVIVTGEFGRTCLAEGMDGRDHHPYAFTSLLAGGGVRGGLTYGTTDEFGFDVVENPVHIHDFHATLLHLFGLDHLRLVHQVQGRDMRLTDVGGRVVHGLLRA
jgi:hypothetical protein